MFPNLEFIKTCLNGLRNRIEKYVDDSIGVVTDEDILKMLADRDILDIVADNNGNILTDNNSNILIY